MTLKFKKPITPSQRGQIQLDTSDLQQNLIFDQSFSDQSKLEEKNFSLALKDLLKKKEKSLRIGKSSTGGRNNQGRITVGSRGGGHKRNQKKVSFKRNNLPFLLMVYSIHQDPNRSANLALLGPVLAMDQSEQTHSLGLKNVQKKENQAFFYILAPKTLKVGDRLRSEGLFQQRKLQDPKNKEFFQKEMNETQLEGPSFGDSMHLQKIPLGSQIHNLELHPGEGGQLIRSAGTAGLLIEKSLEKGQVRIRLPSGIQRWFPFTCRATLGSVGNEDFRHMVLGKAGASRWRGRRPKVRGVAMNPVDHPHGGGEGRTSGGRPSVTPWGRPTRSFRLRKKKFNPFLIP